MAEVSMFGKDSRICLTGPSSRRRTCDIGTIVSPASSRAERATAVYMTHPYFSNRSPAWVTTWSRGIGPSTATLRLRRLSCHSLRTPQVLDPSRHLPPVSSARANSVAGGLGARPGQRPLSAKQDLREALRGFLATPVALQLTTHLDHTGRLAAGQGDAVQPG